MSIYDENLQQRDFLPGIGLTSERKDVHAIFVPEMAIDIAAEAERLKGTMDSIDNVNIFISEGAGLEAAVPVAEVLAARETAEPDTAMSVDELLGGEDTSAELKGGIRRVIGAADYAEVGGAILLGVNGVVVIGHGRSEARAVPPALRAARDDVRRNLNLHITESLQANEGAGAAGGDDGSAAASAREEERL